jgi:hypothetical protein
MSLLGQLDPQEFRDLVAVLEARVMPELNAKIDPLLAEIAKKFQQEMVRRLEKLVHQRLSNLQTELTKQILKAIDRAAAGEQP